MCMIICMLAPPHLVVYDVLYSLLVRFLSLSLSLSLLLPRNGYSTWPICSLVEYYHTSVVINHDIQ